MLDIYKYGIGAVALAAVLFGVRTCGYNDGFEAGTLATEKRYAPVVEECNRERSERNARIELLQDLLNQAADHIIEIQNRKPEIIENTVIEYVERFPEESEKCSLPANAVEFYNKIIGDMK